MSSSLCRLEVCPGAVGIPAPQRCPVRVLPEEARDCLRVHFGHSLSQTGSPVSGSGKGDRLGLF